MADPAAKPLNIHGTAILIGERGVLIVGPSGSGKTTLALALIDHCRARAQFARLVGDDQLFASCHGGRLVCRTPATIAGLVEVPGIGPQPVPFEPAAVIDLAVRLVERSETARLQDEATEEFAGCAVPIVDVVRQNATSALPVVMARLSARLFS
ncbi:MULTISPECIES: serine kinase [unclassified Mesorhizobium]|uniref:HPr kinase/phosphorylase n=1 Tax=unclassified Mesorhizobium TaxID=325217 RepID=UPI000BAFAF14|nr:MULTISPECIES: serine kinase [unclassified Mesorhizobium]TGT60579.1 HPr kinase/phosphorylase [Mesorhizobium sp. M00.F.Ca.ET.170.01.1.1]AZO10320.1 HPr kinase/phosphorylase [Mesorhizobium sp. M3A.F.Ca.ET.080.04.2.1]PBB87844.1 serine kinase [Mesorhizobium sp. WSM3876]RWB73684.1 MAG: HPr kinase/phosphorylase [Mesorhizobium sp.]RWB91760.1 MAG: HPr kinase/phosphorylase [Mesorhizobium sp.]